MDDSNWDRAAELGREERDLLRAIGLPDQAGGLDPLRRTAQSSTVDIHSGRRSDARAGQRSAGRFHWSLPPRLAAVGGFRLGLVVRSRRWTVGATQWPRATVQLLWPSGSVLPRLRLPLAGHARSQARTSLFASVSWPRRVTDLCGRLGHGAAPDRLTPHSPVVALRHSRIPQRTERSLFALRDRASTEARHNRMTKLKRGTCTPLRSRAVAVHSSVRTRSYQVPGSPPRSAGSAGPTGRKPALVSTV